MSSAPEPSDWESLFGWGEKLVGTTLPPPVKIIFGGMVLITVFIATITAIFYGIVQLKKLFQEHLIPRTYRQEHRARSRARRQFASYLKSEIERLNRQENWRDDDFAELEAEVEGFRRGRGIFRLLAGNRLFKERSLSKALAKSQERLVLVEGEPGAGKSVAMRHVAHHAATKAASARKLTTILPVYVNLKELKREQDEEIDRLLIRRIVIRSLRRINDRFIDEFFESEFDTGIRDGRWLFLFDSFDEIPDILSSTDSDKITSAYSSAISDFLGGINKCRGIVASRAYRGPQAKDWVTFRVLPLDWKRQKDLIFKCLINDYASARKVDEGLASTSNDVRAMARNPMLLGLLCEHVKLKGIFPVSTFEVFSKYLDYRLDRDAERVYRKFSISLADLRNYSELAAFSMTADASIGLTPDLSQITSSSTLSGFSINPDLMQRCLHALAYMRLGRMTEEQSDGQQEFTFSHRRFQEYLATQVVLKNQGIIDPNRLLTDGRWRETAVVLLQTASAHTTATIFEEALRLLRAPSSVEAIRNSTASVITPGAFRWKTNELHIYSVLQAGRSGHQSLLPLDLTSHIDERLAEASDGGSLLDQKFALDVGGAASEAVLVRMMQKALFSRSRWVNDVVYQQASRLARPVKSVYHSIRAHIVRLILTGQIESEYRTTKAFISRLPDSRELIGSLKIARSLPIIDRLFFPITAFVSCFLLSIDWRFGFAAAFLHFFSLAFVKESAFSTFIATQFRFAASAVLPLQVFAGKDFTLSSVSLSAAICTMALLYSSALFFCGVLALKEGVLTRPIYVPVFPIAAPRILLLKILRRPSHTILLFAMSVISLIFVVLMFRLLRWLGVEKLVISILPLVSAVFLLAFLALTLKVAATELLAYRRWRKMDNSLSPNTFDQEFRKFDTAFSQTAMLERLGEVAFEKNPDTWETIFLDLVKLVDEDNKRYDKSGRPKWRFLNKDRPEREAKRVNPLNVLATLVIHQDFMFRRRDLLFIYLERLSQAKNLSPPDLATGAPE